MGYPSIRERGRRTEIESRIRSLSPGSVRAWGRMDHAQLLVHLADSVRLSLRGSNTPPRGPFRFAPLRYVVLHHMKWPEGKIQAPPGAFERPPEGWEEDRSTLLDLLSEYFEHDPSELGADHPIFGPMKTRDWDVFLYRHLDHHLRQFSA